jgi:hypothetical protein
MDEAHYCAEAFSPITGRCFQVVSRQGGQAGRAGFCSRSPAEPARSCFNGAGQRRGDPGLDPLGERSL